MPKISVLVLALTSAALSTLPLAAAPVATQGEADRLTAVFERYVGHPGPGEASAVTVIPEGTAYRVNVDLQQMMRPFQSFGLTMEPASQTIILAPNDNGTWHVASDAMPPLVMHLKDQTITMKTSTYAYEGTVDPKLGVFLDQTETRDGATLDQDAPALSQHRRSGHAVATQTGTSTAGDRASGGVHYALSDMTAQMTMRSPPPQAPASAEAAPLSPPVEITYTIPTGTLDFHLDGVRPWSLLDLWAFLVAHPNHDALAASQEELRGLLKAGLPVLAGLRQAASIDAMSLHSPLGDFKADKLAGSLDVADLSGSGKIVSALSIDGLAVPGLSLPPWAIGFLPTSVDIHPSVTGLHINEGVKEAVDSFDLKQDGFTPEQSQKIGHILWPGDGKVMIAPSRIASPLLDLKLEGEATMGDVPAGHLTVTAAGLDKAIGVLQAVADTDPVAGQVLAQFVAAKNLGKPNPDGSFVWVIEGAANGPLSVNGVPLK